MDMYLLCGMGVLLVSLVFCASRMRGCVREGQEDGLEESIKILREAMDKEIDTLSMPKWTLLLNALRTFETKIARMGTECLNENFWEPAG